MTASANHLRGIVIAGGLVALALALAFVTLSMNHTAAPTTVGTVLSLKARRAAAAQKPAAAAVKAKPVNPNLVAALQGGLPRSVAQGLVKAPVVVVEITSNEDPVAQLSFGEAKAGAALGNAAFVPVDVDRDGGAVAVLTRLLGKLPPAPAALVYTRPAVLYVTLPGFNDRTTVQQAAADAALTVPGASAGETASTLTAPSGWASRASAICRRTTAKLASAKATTEAVTTSFLAQMQALTPPAGKAAQVAELNTMLKQGASQQKAAAAASAAHNPKAAALAKARASSYQTRAGKLEQQLGATGCAEAVA